MERLTHIDKYGWYVGDQSVPFDGRGRGEAVDRLASYEDAMPIERAREFAQVEKDGRIVVLPCKPEQTVWVELPVMGRVYSVKAPDITWIVKNMERFGREIFLTREEAEAALRELEVEPYE